MWGNELSPHSGFSPIPQPTSSSSPSPSISSCIRLVSHNSSRHLLPSLSLFLLQSVHPRFSFPHQTPLISLIPSPFSISVPFWIPLPFALSLYVSVSLSPLLSLIFFHPPVFSPFLITCSQPHPLAAFQHWALVSLCPPTPSLPRGSPHPPIPPGTLVSSPHAGSLLGKVPARGLQWGAENWGKVFAQEEGVRGWGWGGQDLGSSRFLESYQDPASDPS